MKNGKVNYIGKEIRDILGNSTSFMISDTKVVPRMTVCVPCAKSTIEIDNIEKRVKIIDFDGNLTLIFYYNEITYYGNNNGGQLNFINYEAMNRLSF